ncbi:MAG: DNA-binding transcriptional regulator [Planctomycetia bacterium]|nr:DNA-binding transcriptional regulator [Planctomycetia bacterium]
MSQPPSTLRILLLMGTSHGYGRLLINGISQYLYEQGCHVDFELRGHLEPIPTWVKKWSGDGIIVRHHEQATFDMLEKMNIPYLRVNCPDHPSDLDVDEVALGRMAVEHFWERGVRDLAFFTQCDHYWTRRRRDGFVQAATERSLAYHLFERHAPDTAPFLTWSRKEQRRLVCWLHELPKPVGILTSYDFHARQVLEVCRQEGISVPESVAVLGINNEKWFCRLQNPPLSSIIQNGRKVGYEAARILCQKIEGKPIPKLPLLFPPVGVAVRRSTDLIAVKDEDMAQAFRLVRNHACEGLTIEKMVEEVGLSRRTLERKFKQAFGRTIGEELIHCRLERAKELLRDTDWPIGNIAMALGFCSHAYFIHVFRQRNHCSPSEYRAKTRIPYDS